MALKLVIFDVDGVLLDTERVWQEVWKDVSKKHSFPIDGELLFKKVIGLTSIQVQDIVKKEFQNEEASNHFLELVKSEGRKRLKKQLKVKHGAYDILNKIKENNVYCAVATSTNKLLTKQRLKKVGLLSYFDYICCGDEVENKKPSPEIYIKVLRVMNVKKEEALVFEDSNVGIEAAKNAGIPYIIVPDIVQPKKELLDSAFALIPDLEKGMDYIDHFM